MTTTALTALVADADRLSDMGRFLTVVADAPEEWALSNELDVMAGVLRRIADRFDGIRAAL